MGGANATHTQLSDVAIKIVPNSQALFEAVEFDVIAQPFKEYFENMTDGPMIQTTAVDIKDFDLFQSERWV